MTINRKLHAAGVTGGGVGAAGGLPLPPVYGDDNPPPLPPLRNPQKALPPPVSTVAGSDASAVGTDPVTAGTDKQIYIYSTAKYGKYDPSTGKGHGQQQQQQQLHAHHQPGGPAPGKYGDAQDKPIATGGSKNPNTTTFSSTPASNSKPLPSIINCPLPDIPKSAPKDDIYVKRKLLSDHPNGSKFATLKPIPVPKIEPGNLPPLHNGASKPLPNGPLTPADAQLPPPPPPPPPATAGSSGSSGGSSSGYGTVGLTTSQIQSLPLPPPPLELLQQQQQQQQNSHQDHQDQALRLPPPPTNEELRSSAMDNGAAGGPAQLNGGGGGHMPNGDTGLTTEGGKSAAVGNDDNSFYAVTEL
uniref:Protein tweety homolog n=1 Tax=Anopheles atroparvus TaxID=41427 RepID=A0AAG5DB20_ANOAO